MNKFFFFSIFFLLLTNCLFCQVTDLNYLEKCLIRIQVYNTNSFEVDSAGLIEGDYSLGSGFYISNDGLFITAAHVIKKRNKDNPAAIKCYDYSSVAGFTVRVIFEDEYSDIALLQNEKYTNFGETNKYFISMHNNINPKVKKGNEVFAFGYPNSLQGYNRICAFTSGIILQSNTNLNGYKKEKSRANVAIANCEVISGFSGGIITEKNFSPLGIILGSIVDNKRSTYFRTVANIIKTLNEYEIPTK